MSTDPGERVWATFLQAWPHWEWPDNPRLLEIGCHDNSWLNTVYTCCPGVQATAVDWRQPPPGPGRRIKGDILAQTFAPGSFDVIVMLSALEHIGLGHYDRDPFYAEGDTVTLMKCAEWLAPGGSIYADVPYTPDGYQLLNKTKCRCYDQAAILSRLDVPGLSVGNATYADAFGRRIPRPDHNRVDAKKPFVYVALLWRKE